MTLPSHQYMNVPGYATFAASDFLPPEGKVWARIEVKLCENCGRNFVRKAGDGIRVTGKVKLRTYWGAEVFERDVLRDPGQKHCGGCVQRYLLPEDTSEYRYLLPERKKSEILPTVHMLPQVMGQFESLRGIASSVNPWHHGTMRRRPRKTTDFATRARAIVEQAIGEPL